MVFFVCSSRGSLVKCLTKIESIFVGNFTPHSAQNSERKATSAACVRVLVNVFSSLETKKKKEKKRTVKAPWDFRTADFAAKNGNHHILKYLVERKYDEFSKDACYCAAMEGHLDGLKYLHETAEVPWDEDAVRVAYRNKRSECLQYLLDNDCPLPPGW